MPYRIAIASGKGGTGKTTVAANLFHLLNQETGRDARLVDCDVEEPNTLIFFDQAKSLTKKTVFQLVPLIDPDKCTFCKKCTGYCEFNAITMIPPAKFIEVNSALCHSCGACLEACTENAITEQPEPIGDIELFRSGEGYMLAEGRLKTGSAMQTMLIRELKKFIPSSREIIIYDSPPGTSCPVVATISDVNLVILVAEPTLFGLNDLQIMVELLEELEKDFVVIINKSGANDALIENYLAKVKVEIIGKIPFSIDYAKEYANGLLFDNVPEEISNPYKDIARKLKERVA